MTLYIICFLIEPMIKTCNQYLFILKLLVMQSKYDYLMNKISFLNLLSIYNKTYRSRHSASENPTLTRLFIGHKICAIKAALSPVFERSSYFLKKPLDPESKNRRPYLSLCDIILRLKRGKRGSCSYF